jgi:uncharacterized protein YybS (DUF2232 family)
VERDFNDLFLLNPQFILFLSCSFVYTSSLVRDNILRIAIDSVKNKCNRNGVVNVFFLSISVSIFLLRFPSNDALAFCLCASLSLLYSSLYSLLFSFSSKTHNDDHEEAKNENIKWLQKEEKL